MNNFESKSVTVIRYILWMIFAAGTVFLREAAVSKSGLNILIALVFVVVGVITSRIMAHRYSREQILLGESKIYLRDSVSKDFKLILVAVILIGLIRIIISWLQIKGIFPKFANDYYTSTDQKVLLFNMFANICIVSYQQLMVSEVFLYNYFWRQVKTSSYILGIIMSGIVLAAISLITSYPEFILLFLLSIVYTFVYRRTNDFKLTLILIIFSNIMGTLII